METSRLKAILVHRKAEQRTQQSGISRHQARTTSREDIKWEDPIGTDRHRAWVHPLEDSKEESPDGLSHPQGLMNLKEGQK